MRAQVAAGKFKLQAGATVGSKYFAIGGESEQTFHQCANKFGTDMKGNNQLTCVGASKQRLLYYLRAHSHQRHGVLVKTTIVAGNVEHSEQVSCARKNG